MSRGGLIWKQTIKYVLIIAVAVAGLSGWKLLWSAPVEGFWWAFGIAAGIIVVAVIFDLLSVKDVIPIFKK